MENVIFNQPPDDPRFIRPHNAAEDVSGLPKLVPPQKTGETHAVMPSTPPVFQNIQEDPRFIHQHGTTMDPFFVANDNSDVGKLPKLEPPSYQPPKREDAVVKNDPRKGK